MGREGYFASTSARSGDYRSNWPALLLQLQPTPGCATPRHATGPPPKRHTGYISGAMTSSHRTNNVNKWRHYAFRPSEATPKQPRDQGSRGVGTPSVASLQFAPCDASQAVIDSAPGSARQRRIRFRKPSAPSLYQLGQQNCPFEICRHKFKYIRLQRNVFSFGSNQSQIYRTIHNNDKT